MQVPPTTIYNYLMLEKKLTRALSDHEKGPLLDVAKRLGTVPRIWYSTMC